MRSALYEWPFTMHLLWQFRCIIDVLLEGITGLMVAGDFATDTTVCVKTMNSFKTKLEMERKIKLGLFLD